HISLTAVLEFGPTEILPPIVAISKHPSVSADPIAKPAAQTRAESRVLDLRKRLRERDRLSAGGRWIRTCMGLFLSSGGFWFLPVLCSELESRSSSRRLRSGSRSARD